MPRNFENWLRRLDIAVQNRLGSEVPYDLILAKNYFREGETPEQFLEDHLMETTEAEDVSFRDLL